jgi:hypothetical protein
MMSIEQLAKLVEALPEAQTLDLYRLEYAIQSLRSEPRRTLAIRTRVHLGMTVRFFNAIDGNHLSGQIVAMHDVDLSIRVPAENRRYTGVPYAALDLEGAAEELAAVIDQEEPPPRQTKQKSRSDFRVGDSVSFLDRSMQPVAGKIVKLNPKTASIKTSTSEWRVAYQLLQHIVDI